MTTLHRYVWVKVSEAKPGTITCDAAEWYDTPQPDFAISGGVLPPAPPPPRDVLAVRATCAPCPKPAPVGTRTAVLTSPPTPPGSTGWRLDSCLAEFTQEATGKYFACHPIDGNYDAAVNWLASDEGRAWVGDAIACTLLSHFSDGS